MKLLYAEVISCGQEPDQKVLEQELERAKKEKKEPKEKIRYIFDYKVSEKEVLPSGKEYIKTQILQGKSKIVLKPGVQFLEITEGVVSGNYWFVVEATHQKIGK